MKILIVHNKYQYAGGEDVVVQAEKEMLERFGHEVILYERSNSEINTYSLLKKVVLVLNDFYWSKSTYQSILQIVKREKPDIAHFHNAFFLISPSAYDACYAEKIPIVQTIHNYRFMCPVGTFYRNGRVCEDCLSHGKISSIIHRCWKNSYFHSFVLALIMKTMKERKIVSHKINRFILLSPFSEQKFIENGFDPKKLVLKPNFVHVNCRPNFEQSNYCLFVGALRDYKGIQILLRAWKTLKTNLLLKVIGQKSISNKLVEGLKDPRIEFLGSKSLEETISFIQKALFLVVPSECYESFPRVIVEAFACGIPVIASNHGALKDLVKHKKTGLLFEPGNLQDLKEKLDILIHSPLLCRELGENARKEYQKNYTMEKNYATLMSIYSDVLRECQDNQTSSFYKTERSLI